MAAADFKPTIVDVPVGFLIETSEKNLLWLIFRVTGEQLYNWGLRQGAFVAFAVTWSTSYLQHWALAVDRFMGAALQVLGIDFGDEASKLCCRVWREQSPDMVPSLPFPAAARGVDAAPAGAAAQICNFTTGTSRFMAKGLRRAGLSHVPVVVVISDFEGVGVHSWVEDRADNVVCGTSLSRQQALDHGIPRSQVRPSSPPQPAGNGRGGLGGRRRNAAAEGS